MRAQVLEAFNTPYVLRDVPAPPAPSGQDVLVAVEAASYCHTDAVFASGAMQWRALPRIGSHEFAGTVVALGPAVPAALDLAVGQRVGVPGRAFRCCGACAECVARNGGDPPGYGVHCPKARNLGLSADGGFQERCLVDARQVAPAPPGLRAVEVAPLMCAGLTVWSALERGGVALDGEGNGGVAVAVAGAGGGLGHLGVQFAARLGCEVVALEASDRALELLREVVRDLGPDGERVTVVDVRAREADEVRYAVCGAPEEPALAGEKGVDCALVLPEAQRAFDYCMKLLRDHGTCVCVSFPKDGFRFQPADLVFRHIKMVGVLVGRNRQLRAMLNFAATHGVRAKTTTYPLERLNDLVDDYHKGASGKLVIDMAL